MGRWLALCWGFLPVWVPDPLSDDPPKPGKPEKVILFQGKDLDAWDGLKDKYWSIRDGTIVGQSEEEFTTSTYLVTRQRFRDFHLSLSVRVSGTATRTGVAFWGEVVANRDDPFAYKGYLVVFPKPWGLYETFGRGNLAVDPRPAMQATRPQDWNDMEIFAQGNRVRVVLNGVLILDWSDPEPDRIKAGPIALQLRASELPQQVSFKNIRVTTPPDDSRLQDKKVGDRIPPSEPAD
ncbi:MAG: DUF1080 domain-containing protein [Gemmataceae bacterium]|nr:DUF1080 domain-containing protein [Gemmataceae bacterium]